MPMFSKKHYEALAAALKEARAATDGQDGGTAFSIVGEMIGIGRAQACITDILAADNPLFDGERFAQASGMRG